MIGFITYFQTDNYGVIFQAYATQIIFDIMGNKIELINYKSPNLTRRNFKKIVNQLKIKDSIINKSKFLFAKVLNKYLFYIFRNKCIASSKPYSRRKLSKLSTIYHAIIVGSDQLWNIDINNYDYSYYLDFYNGKKYSFSTSFGANFIYNNEHINHLLNDFKLISVREFDGKTFIHNNINKNALITLDPTLILPKKFWAETFRLNKQDLISPYIFAYIIGIPHIELLNKCVSVEKFNTKILLCNSTTTSKSWVHKRWCSPENFLKLIYNATFIITNSYHGILFAIQFKKPFKYLFSSYDSRFENIVNLLKLSGTYTHTEDGYIFTLSIESYKNINHELQLQRNNSNRYINDIITDIYSV